MLGALCWCPGGECRFSIAPSAQGTAAWSYLCKAAEPKQLTLRKVLESGVQFLQEPRPRQTQVGNVPCASGLVCLRHTAMLFFFTVPDTETSTTCV